MIIIKTNKLKIGGIALFPLVFINSTLSSERQTILINHERIHIRQQIELLVVPFYFIYLISYLYFRMKGFNHQLSYRKIIFEKEAFSNEKNLDYLRQRKLLSFRKYFFSI